ncbi:MAG: tetratricopeptide repeat protein [Lactobacillus sp.]|nr:tetratricopeptide repeat protein [Lactobacillus sp.]MCH3906466.1 tetratricopeptide repeat protein [Lactobacillus sp.]MCH3989956.1 tetratricopeptide repeat protein [Lactobacillus sp.]MCH4069329.1 tetratricopeptide repeat protein [Lactobacillus sp.]MCI1303683.1 tetratricopeptide repeat protein [Lactobacillus sp.]
MNQKIDQLYQAGQTDKAIHLLVQAIDAHPQEINNYLQLSTYLLEQGSADQAQKLLEQAQHLVKKPRELLYNLAICYYMQGEFQRALTILNEIPNTDPALYQKALVYLKLGQPERGLAFALTIKQADAKVWELLGDLWLNLGETEQASHNFAKIAPEQRTAKVWFLLGVALINTDHEQAEAAWQKSKQLDLKYYEQAMKQYQAIITTLQGQQGKKHD